MDTRKIKYNNGIPFYPVIFPANEADGILIEELQIQRLIDYVNCYDIKSAYICNVSTFDFLYQCKSLEHITIELKVMNKDYSSLEKQGTNKLIKKYDVTPLYSLKNLKSLTLIDLEVPYINSQLQIDLSKFAKLEMFCGESKYVNNLNQLDSLKSLMLNNYNHDNLEELSMLRSLDTICLNSSKIKSLIGCEKLHNLKCLYLYNNRLLENISPIKEVKGLRALRIENSRKIANLEAIDVLSELELLEISGNNEIPSLNFINKMKNLKTFIFSVNVKDGNLTPCLNLQYVYCDRGRKHYNLKDKDLPKGKFIRGNEDIDLWRRFE